MAAFGHHRRDSSDCHPGNCFLEPGVAGHLRLLDVGAGPQGARTPHPESCLHLMHGLPRARIHSHTWCGLGLPISLQQHWRGYLGGELVSVCRGMDRISPCIHPRKVCLQREERVVCQEVQSDKGSR